MPSPNPGSHSINRNSPVPLYQQIAAKLLRDIRDHSPSPRRRSLPSETELTERYKVSRVTIRRALEELERTGVIYREKGRGSFIRRSRISGFSIFGSFSAEVSYNGRIPDCQVLDVRLVDSLPAQMLLHFGLTPERSVGERFVLLKRLRLVDGAPAALEEAYLPHSAFPGLEQIDFSDNQSLFAVLVDNWGVVPVWGEALVESVPAAPDEAGLMGLEAGAPLLVAWRVSTTKSDEVVEYVRSAYSSRHLMLNIGRHRIQS